MEKRPKVCIFIGHISKAHWSAGGQRFCSAEPNQCQQLADEQFGSQNSYLIHGLGGAGVTTPSEPITDR